MSQCYVLRTLPVLLLLHICDARVCVCVYVCVFCNAVNKDIHIRVTTLSINKLGVRPHGSVTG
jgi:hypothetical protein